MDVQLDTSFKVGLIWHNGWVLIIENDSKQIVQGFSDFGVFKKYLNKIAKDLTNAMIEYADEVSEK